MATVGTQSITDTSSLKRLSTAAAGFCLIVLMGAYVTNAMDRQIFPILLPLITKHYGYSVKTAGFLATVFNLGIGAAGIPAGYLVDRWSRRSILIAGMIIYSVFTILTVCAMGILDMAIYRALTGIGESMQITALFVAVGSYFFRYRAATVGVINLGWGVGTAIGPYLGTRLTLASGSWKPPFVVFGFFGIVMASVIAVLIPRVLTEQKSTSFTSVERQGWAKVPKSLLNWNTCVGALCTLCLGTVMWGFLGLYATFLSSQLHFSPMIRGTVLSMYGFGCMFGWLAGWVGDRVSTRGTIIAAHAALSVLTYLIYQVATLPWEHYVMTFLMGLLLSSTLHPNTLAFIQKSVLPEKAGMATGLFTTLQHVGGGLAGFWFGLLVDKFGWSWAALVQESMLPLVAIILMFAAKPDLQWKERK